MHWLNYKMLAFGHFARAFIAISNEGGMDATISTGLPPGTYCDVITGCATDTGCTGGSVVVDSSGEARVLISNHEEPMLAIHVGQYK